MGSDSQDRLNELLARCVEAYRNRDSAAIDRILVEHPEHAVTIRDRLDELTRRGVLHDDADLPSQVGPYRILEEIGRGGMGSVYRAEQREPVKRTVALKIIRLGMDTRDVVARFEAERQALALMNHPNIAQVFDAGATERGRPYFVMEYVPGLPIVDYCDRQGLTTEERLELFITVCDAVQHAHQKGIIHRDLKPSNVLVMLLDGQPVAKVIDFGVAKATNQRLSEATLFTELGVILGTPAYMSPEQAGTTQLDVDTRTDVYSLGVVLYELLTGTLPFPVNDRGIAEMQRVICDVDPPRPSTRVGALGDDAQSVAHARQTHPTALARRLRGDLDWIAIKAMAKDRGKRYGTALELGADVRRHLSHEPVSAGPPSRTDRLAKFVRRHRAGVTAAAIAALLLVAGLVSTTWMYLIAERNAEKALRGEEEAIAQAAIATGVNEILDLMLTGADPSLTDGRDVTVKEVLDEASTIVDSEKVEDPRVEASLRGTLGAAYARLGRLPQAERHLRHALELWHSVPEPNPERVVVATTHLAALLFQKQEFDEALSQYRRALEMRRSANGDEHPETLELTVRIAVVMRNANRVGEARELLETTLSTSRMILGDEHRVTISAMNSLAQTLLAEGAIDEGYAMMRDALALAESAIGERDELTSLILSNLAVHHTRRGEFGDAIPLIERAVRVQSEQLEPDHPQVINSKYNLASLYRRVGRTADAKGLFRETLDSASRNFGPEHTLTARQMTGLGITLCELGEREEGEALIREALEIQLATGGPKSRDTQETLASLANLLDESGEHDEAASLRSMLAR